MAFRYWLSGPRILGGLVRPGISFYAKDLARRRSSIATSRSIFAIVQRPDGAIKLDAGHAEEPGGAIALVVWFSHPDAADEVMLGANVRLRKHVNANGWVIGLSVGQVVAAVKSEATALGHKYTLARRADIEALQQRKPRKTERRGRFLRFAW